jgi:histidinol dehydrogenase
MIRRYTKEPANLLDRRWPKVGTFDEDLIDYVSKIIEDVRIRGDKAVIEYTKRFDNVELRSDTLRVGSFEIQEAYSEVEEEQITAIEESKRRLEKIERKRMELLSFDVDLDGIMIRSRVKPISKVGCYVPGGKAAYPSTLIMNVVPAKVADVNNIVVVTPPKENGKVNPLTLVASDICDVEEVYRIGGIQGIAALTYGTETIPAVDKIVGPGNKFITAAKMLVSRRVAIDKPAGPSEILIIADDSADPHLIALDMISQAEHGSDGISGLVTNSKKLADKVESNLKEILENIPDKELVWEVLSKGGFIYLSESLFKAVNFINSFAPEHLEIITNNPDLVLSKINTTGLVLIGPYTPVASTDYCMGVNHVLPTGGYAKIWGGTTILDYLKPVSVIKSTKEGLNKVRRVVKTMAYAEGLPNHCLAVEGRFRD